jgi:hypothetical protein
MYQAVAADRLGLLKRTAVEAPFGIIQEIFTLAAQAVFTLVVVGAIEFNHRLDRSFFSGDPRAVSVWVSRIHGSNSVPAHPPLSTRLAGAPSGKSGIT